MKTDYAERRTTHALRVDRAINARKHWDSFVPPYRAAPNRSDVVGYDNRPVRGGAEELRGKEGADEGYVPYSVERRRLVRYFHGSMSRVEQHKDLLVTKNVIKRKADLDKWRKEPKWYDVVGVDTRPREVVEGRLRALREAAGNPDFRYGVKRRGALGVFSVPMLRSMRPGYSGAVTVVPSVRGSRLFGQVVGHEFGHAYDYNVVTPGMAKLGIVPGGTNYAGEGSRGKIPSFKPLQGTRYRLRMEKAWVGAVRARDVVQPFDKRMAKEEVLAGWIGGLVSNKMRVKGEGRQFYNVFRKGNKGLMRALRESDRRATAPFIGGKL